MTRVVVVGGGVAGLAAAWTLATHGAEVVMVRSGRPRASVAAAGMLSPMPEAAVTPGLVRMASEALHHYPTFLAALAEDTDRDPGFVRSGVLRVAATEAERASLREEVGTYEAAGLPSQWLDGRSLRRLAPGLPESLPGGLLSFDEAQVQPAWLLEALEEAAFRRGATAAWDEAVGVEATDEGAAVTLASGARLEADRVVLAAGSWSATLGGAAVPVRPVKGQLLAFENVTGPAPILYHGHHYLVAKPDGSVLLGGTMAEAGFDLQPDADAEALRDRLPGLWPALAGRPATTRVGLRPAAPDGLPVCGPIPAMRAAYAFTGHHRNGFLLAPHQALLMSRELLEGTTENLLATVRPARFSTG